MTVRISKIPKNPYLGYDAGHIARLAAACFQCRPPAPCTRSCPRQTDIPGVIRLAGHAACEGLSLKHWFWDRDRVEAARICDDIADAYT